MFIKSSKSQFSPKEAPGKGGKKIQNSAWKKNIFPFPLNIIIPCALLSFSLADKVAEITKHTLLFPRPV